MSEKNLWNWNLRKWIAAYTILMLCITLPFIGYQLGYSQGETTGIDETIRSVKIWSNGGYVNTTLYNMSWYTMVGSSDRAPTLADDGFILNIMLTVENVTEDWALFDLYLSFAHTFGDITMERLVGYLNRETGLDSFDYYFPFHSTGVICLFDVLGTANIIFFGHGSSVKFADLVASLLIEVRT